MTETGCFISSVFHFLGEFQILLYILAGFLLAGWAISLIVGAKINIMNNMRNLCIMFVILSLIRPVMAVMYGSSRDFDSVACRTVKVSAEEVRRLLEQSMNARLTDGFVEGAVRGGAAAPNINVEVVRETPRQQIQNVWRGRRIAPNSVRTGGGRRNIVQIENTPLRAQMGTARDVIQRYNIAIREAHWGGGDGRLGARRDRGARDHAGTDLLPGGRPPAPGTAFPALFDGEVIQISNLSGRDRNLMMIVIQNDNGSRSRMLYVSPAQGIARGTRVRAGDTVGVTQDIRRAYGVGTAQHVHFELHYRGNLIDIETLFE